jgi:hypothetical protein
MTVIHLKPLYATRDSPLCASLDLSIETGIGTAFQDSITCPKCVVVADQMLEEGDLKVVVSTGGVRSYFCMEVRPFEYRTLDNFMEYLRDEERTHCSLRELQELAEHSGERMSYLRSELRRCGVTVEHPLEPKQVRSINSYGK